MEEVVYNKHIARMCSIKLSLLCSLAQMAGQYKIDFTFLIS